MVNNRNNTCKMHAFTMVELAVTLAIVAALAAVLFPVIASGRSLRNRGCLSNHHELVRAVSMYTEDFGDGELTNKVQLDPYIARTLLECPNTFSPGFRHTPNKDRCADDDARHGDEDHGRGCPDNGSNKAGGGSSGPNMTNHGGTIMTTSVTASIFWGKSWANSSFVADKVSGLDL
jgi:prepilin-type N-terminal cleavage/methylation domain-containing protein